MQRASMMQIPVGPSRLSCLRHKPKTKVACTNWHLVRGCRVNHSNPALSPYCLPKLLLSSRSAIAASPEQIQAANEGGIRPNLLFGHSSVTALSRKSGSSRQFLVQAAFSTDKMHAHGYTSAHMALDSTIRDSKQYHSAQASSKSLPTASSPIHITASCGHLTAGSLSACQKPVRPVKSTTSAVPVGGIAAVRPSANKTLFVFDFDNTLTNWDAGEQLVEDLASDLLPDLMAVQMPANFLPITNTILSKLSERGVSRGDLVGALRKQAIQFPSATRQLLQLAVQQGADVKVLSDCNTFFISEILSHAEVLHLFSEIITNPSTFHDHSAMTIGADDAPAQAATGTSRANATSVSGAVTPTAPEQQQETTSGPQQHSRNVGLGRQASKLSKQHQLVINPCHNRSFCCNRCPENLCKGAEVKRLLALAEYERIIYCGDGANDICPALVLRDQDVVLARGGCSLAKYLVSAAEGDGKQVPKAQFSVWQHHEELLQLVTALL